MLGRGVHTRRHHYKPSCGTPTIGFGARSYRTVYFGSSIPSVERVYVSPPPEVIEYLPIEQAPVVAGGPQVLDPRAGPRSFVEQGDAAFGAGSYEEARRLYVRAVLAAEPGAQMAYALAHFASGDYDVAAAALRRALTTDPAFFDLPADWASRFPAGNEFERHRSMLRDHLAGRPADLEARLLAAYVEYAAGDATGALVLLDNLLTRHPDDTLAALLRDAVARRSRPPS